MSDEFKNPTETERRIEEAKNQGFDYTNIIRDGIRNARRTRTHQDGNSIIETRTGTDVFGNTHILYLRREPTTELLEMRNNS